MTLSATAKAALFAQQTSEVLLVCCVIEHPDIPESELFSAGIVRVVRNTEEITVAGLADATLNGTYKPFPFDIVIPSQDQDAPAESRLVIDNSDRQIVVAVRSIDTAPDVTMFVVLADSPNVVEFGPFTMQLRDVQYDRFTIEGRLTFDDFLNESYPTGTFNEQTHPGMFP